MATHSSILAWEIPRTEGPGGPQSIGSQNVGHGHDWASKQQQHKYNLKPPCSSLSHHALQALVHNCYPSGAKSHTFWVGLIIFHRRVFSPSRKYTSELRHVSFPSTFVMSCSRSRQSQQACCWGHGASPPASPAYWFRIPTRLSS